MSDESRELSLQPNSPFTGESDLQSKSDGGQTPCTLAMNPPPSRRATHAAPRLPRKGGVSPGFSLVEAMVATLLLAIGFTGLFALTATSTTTLDKAFLRQNLEMQANSILEQIEQDAESASLYTLDLTDCTPPEDPNPQANLRVIWCEQLNAATGDAQANDVRSITARVDGETTILTVHLTALDGDISVAIRRLYD